MDNRNIFDSNKFSGKKIVYCLALGAAVLAIAVISFLSYRSAQDSIANDRIENEVTEKTDTVDSNVENITEQPTVQPETDVAKDPAVETKKTEKETEPLPKESTSVKYIMPVKGEVSVGFSLKTPVYSQTLKDWRVHDGIDIAADIGSVVVAAGDGAVERVYKDDLFGMVVVIKHTDGKKTVYSNLEDNIELEEGQIINSGDTVGKIGQTAICEISDGPHLHFEMFDGKNKIDPLTVIK